MEFKIIGGLKFAKIGIYFEKYDAQKQAMEIRNLGYNARVIGTGNNYDGIYDFYEVWREVI